MKDCIVWLGATNDKGYGQVRVDGVIEYVHRRAWRVANGPIPEGMVVMHTCDNPPCFNLEHLRLGTVADNQADMAVKGRGRNGNTGKTECIHGHEFSEGNTYRPPSGGRYCRACRTERQREARAR